MSLFYYIGASKELDLGTFGVVELERTCGLNETPKIIEFKTSVDEIGVDSLKGMIDISKYENYKVTYQSTVDACGIRISELADEVTEIKKHFDNKYVYFLSAEWGILGFDEKMKKISEESYLENRKCLDVLFDYIRDRIEGNEFIEVYSCWADEESHDRNYSLDESVDLNKFVFSSSFNIDDKKYIRFTK